MTVLTIACAVGSAAAAGAFFTFSDFTMKGLRSMRPAEGAAAMQAINKAAPSPLFMLLPTQAGVNPFSDMYVSEINVLPLRDTSF